MKVIPENMLAGSSMFVFIIIGKLWADLNLYLPGGVCIQICRNRDQHFDLKFSMYNIWFISLKEKHWQSRLCWRINLFSFYFTSEAMYMQREKNEYTQQNQIIYSELHKEF